VPAPRSRFGARIVGGPGFSERLRRESAARIVAAIGIDDLFDLKVAP
jgi:hypothetical protein